MLDPEAIDDEILNDIASRLGLEDWDDEEQVSLVMKTIAEMSPGRAFSEYLACNGIHGYSDSIIRAIDSIREAVVIEADEPGV